MASGCSIDNDLWKYFVVSCGLLALSNKVVSGGCGSNNNRRNNDGNDDCWYELWYFWFIVALVFIIIVVLFIFYCKHQVKRSTGRRARRRTPVLTMPIAPPEYGVPGHEPPPYHIAMTSRAPGPDCTAAPGTSAAGGGAHGVPAPSSASSLQVTSLPGYIMDPAEYHHDYDNLSLASTVSMGTMSSPPPYSPPNYPPSHFQQGQADVVL